MKEAVGTGRDECADGESYREDKENGGKSFKDVFADKLPIDKEIKRRSCKFGSGGNVASRKFIAEIIRGRVG